MKAALTVVILVCSAAISGAQERLADQLRKGIVQEEANQNLEKAITAYQAIVAQFDEDRKVAATALFRLAECCRKAGKREQAVAAYQRVVREFSDQAALVEPSRQQLASTYGISEPKLARSTTPIPPGASREQAISARERDILARQMEVKAAERDLAAVQDKISTYQLQIKNGFGSIESMEYRQLERELAAANDHLDLARTDLQAAVSLPAQAQPRQVTSGSSRSAGPREVTPESLEALKLEIQAMDARLARSKQMVEVGTLSSADYQQLQTDYQKLILQYQQQQKQRDAALALNERLVKSLEDEIALVKERIAAIEKRVTAGTVQGDNPELLQLHRDLLSLQRKLDELKLGAQR